MCQVQAKLVEFTFIPVKNLTFFPGERAASSETEKQSGIYSLWFYFFKDRLAFFKVKFMLYVYDVM